MAAHDLHRLRLALRRVRPVDRQRLRRAERRPEFFRPRGVEIGVGDARIARVGFAGVPVASRRHVVDMLERAPDPLRPAPGLDRDVKPDQRDVALRADRMAGGEGFCDVDDLGALDVMARPRRRRIGSSQGAPGRLDRDRPDGKTARAARVRQLLPKAPAAGGEGREFRLVEMGLVAGIGAVLRDKRIGGRARQRSSAG